MSFINLEDLPFVGMSYEFVGATQGAPFSCNNRHCLPRRSLGVGGRQIDIHAKSKIRPDELVTHALPGTSLPAAP